MTPNSSKYIVALDVGERRIGIAKADTQTRVALPLATLDVDGREAERLREIIAEHKADMLVVGLPRNQAGQETAQSKHVRDFVDQKLAEIGVPVVFQDESLTSVLAEEQLIAQHKPYTKGMIDMYAAAIILRDYLEAHYGH